MKDASDREQLRLPFVAASRLRRDDRWDAAMLCNLSSRGLYLHVDHPPRDATEVRFPLPDGGPPVTAVAEPRWTQRDAAPWLPVRCGLSFVELAGEDRDRILRLVDRFRTRPTPVLGIEQPHSGLLRVPLIVPCTLAGDFGEAAGKTCNLSVFGVYATLAPIPERGVVGRLRLELPSPIGRFEREVTVAWRNPEPRARPHTLPDGCGLRFEELSTLDIRRLWRLVEDHLARLPGTFN